MPPRKAAAKPPAKTPMEQFRASLTKKYGDRIAVPATARATQYTSTGLLSLDFALRTGGWPRGRISEVVGQPGCSKTSTMITSMAEQQKAFPDKAVCYIDMEQTFDYDWAEALGLDTSDERFIHVLPQDSEDVADVLRDNVESKLISCAIVDSIGGMESKKILDLEADKTRPGTNASVITRMIKVAATTVRQRGVTVVLVNQFRANIGGYGPDEIPAGPKLLGYATTTQVVFRRTSATPLTVTMSGEKEEVGRQFRARVSRSKVAAQGRVAEFWLLNQPTDKYGPIGFYRADEAFTIGSKTHVIVQRGAWYDIPGLESANGKPAAIEALRQNPDAVAEVRRLALLSVGKEGEDDGDGPDGA
jgi:recombination protein RecA